MRIADIQRDAVEIQRDAGEIQRDPVEIQEETASRLKRLVNPLGYNGVVRATVNYWAPFEAVSARDDSEEKDDDAHILRSYN